MANIIGSPRLALKMKTRDAVNKIKSGSPKLQNVLRQRCRDRMREKRGELFNTRRTGVSAGNNGEEMLQDTLTEIVRQVFSDLTTMGGDRETGGSIMFNEPLTEEEIFELEAEILDEEEQLLLQEYEQFQENDNNIMNIFIEDAFKDIVICPMCERSGLNETPNGLICPACNLCLPPKLSLSQLAAVITHQLDAHSAVCPERASFMTLPENNSLSLYFLCETCKCFSLIL